MFKVTFVWVKLLFFVIIIGQCKECKNFNSMFAIVSGLGHGAVTRLRQTWDKLPGKYQRIFNDLQQLMDPSRNMSKYRQLVSAEQTQPPIVSILVFIKIRGQGLRYCFNYGIHFILKKLRNILQIFFQFFCRIIWYLPIL